MCDMDKEIRENWFKNHIAKYEELNDQTKILTWHEPGTIFYYVRYIFDGNKLYVSGDLGEAVFCLTWKADIHSFNNLNLHYFESELSAYSGDRRDFNEDKATKALKEWQNELDEDEIEYDREEMNELIECVKSCSRKDEWAYEYVNGRYNDFIGEIDTDYWEWMYDIGDEIPTRIKSYLIGLQMASEQLLAKEIR